MLRLFFIVFLCVNWSVADALVLEDLVKNDKVESTLSYKKVGYYIGSFDPLHLGHEAVANQVLDQNLCDYVLIYPAWGGDEYKNRTDVKIRLEMLFATFENHPKIIVTKLTPGELQQALMQNADSLIIGKPSVKTKIPGVKYIGIIGSDTAIDTSNDLKKLSVFMKGIQIPEKYKHHTIGGIIAIPVQSFVIGLRSGDSIESLNGKFGDRPIIKIIQTNYTDSTSTKIRESVKTGKTIDGFVNQNVKTIIEKYKLYRK